MGVADGSETAREPDLVIVQHLTVLCRYCAVRLLACQSRPLVLASTLEEETMATRRWWVVTFISSTLMPALDDLLSRGTCS